MISINLLFKNLIFNDFIEIKILKLYDNYITLTLNKPVILISYSKIHLNIK